jgi:outer membrane protein
MKRLPLFALFLASAPAIVALGQAAATPKPAANVPVPVAKVAVIAFQAERDVAELQKKYDPRRNNLKSLNDEIDTLNKQLQADDAKLTDADRATRARVIDEKKKQLDRDTQDAQSDFQNDMQQIIGDVAQKVGALLSDYADKHGYTLVLDEGDQQSQTVLYALPTMEITKDIIDAYNAKSGVAAPVPSQGGVDAPQPQPAH